MATDLQLFWGSSKQPPPSRLERFFGPDGAAAVASASAPASSLVTGDQPAVEEFISLEGLERLAVGFVAWDSAVSTCVCVFEIVIKNCDQDSCVVVFSCCRSECGLPQFVPRTSCSPAAMIVQTQSLPYALTAPIQLSSLPPNWSRLGCIILLA